MLTHNWTLKTMQPGVSSLASSDYRVSQQAYPAWSKAVILILMSCLLVPRGVEFQLGAIRLDPLRIFLAFFALIAMSRLLSGTIQLRATLADLLMFIHVGTISLSAFVHEGFGRGMEPALGAVGDMGLAYFVARVFICNLQCYRYFVRIVLIIAVVSAVFGLVEMVTGYSIIRAAYHTLFPKVTFVHLQSQRLSLYRAAAAFRVEILFGLYCATVFALAVCVKHYHLKMSRGLYRGCLILSVMGVFTSLSSGPWMALVLCVCCLLYGRMMRSVSNRWMLLLITIGLGLLFLNLVSNRGPIKLIISYLTLSPQTGYIRLAMWECIWALIPEYWLLGWGWSNDWPRSVEWYHWNSIDSLYAVLIVRSGVFAVLSLLGFLAYSWFRLSRSMGRSPPLSNEATGWILSTVCLFVTAIAVDIFGNLIFATYFILGAGQTLFTAHEPVPHYRKRFQENPSVRTDKLDKVL